MHFGLLGLMYNLRTPGSKSKLTSLMLPLTSHVTLTQSLYATTDYPVAVRP